MLGMEGNAPSLPRGSVRAGRGTSASGSCWRTGDAPESRRETVVGEGRPQACRCWVAHRGAVAAPARAARPQKCSPLPREWRGTFFLGFRGPLVRSTSPSHRVDPP
ncbi:hypothetical protein PAL_GLEAN10022782 [Pteropus alecto]|uniref:Uncharacterized protein n=1 Tax=Pteropus alecto TaxID=9402 RepID=L5K595_PTEAL|nr:hypothetical protein PAL_GLEAN10022782 [Pteropus alecto]